MKITAPIALLIVGVIWFGLCLVMPADSGYFGLIGWLFFASAFFIGLVRAYRSKAPFYWVGGKVAYQTQPGLYKFFFLLVFVTGALGVVVLLSMYLFPRL